MPQFIDINNPPENLDELLEEATPELKALEKSSLVRRLASRERVLDLTDILLTNWMPLAPSMVTELSPERVEQRKAEAARLDTRAWVFYAADLAAEEGGVKARIVLAKANKAHDRFLSKWAWPFFGDDPEHAATLRDIARGSGLRDDAEDVLRLATLFRNNPWTEIDDNGKKLDKAYIHKAGADAAKQLNYLRNRAANPARKLADAAYSLWFADYDEIMQLGRYLTRRQPDSIERFPGVRELPSGGGGAAPAEEPADEELDELDDDEDLVDEDADADAEAEKVTEGA